MVHKQRLQSCVPSQMQYLQVPDHAVAAAIILHVKCFSQILNSSDSLADQ